MVDLDDGDNNWLEPLNDGDNSEEEADGVAEEFWSRDKYSLLYTLLSLHTDIMWSILLRIPGVVLSNISGIISRNGSSNDFRNYLFIYYKELLYFCIFWLN